MIKILVRFVAFLESRFPEKVHVTVEKLAELESRIYRCDKNASGFGTDFAILAGRIASVEASIAAMKEALGKTIAPAAVSAEKRRADFIGSGRITD